MKTPSPTYSTRIREALVSPCQHCQEPINENGDCGCKPEDLKLRANILYRGKLVEVEIIDTYHDHRDQLRLNVRAVEGMPFHQRHVQIADPKYGGGHGWESRTAYYSPHVLSVRDVWEVSGDEIVNFLGLPPVVEELLASGLLAEATE